MTESDFLSRAYIRWLHGLAKTKPALAESIMALRSEPAQLGLMRTGWLLGYGAAQDEMLKLLEREVGPCSRAS